MTKKTNTNTPGYISALLQPRPERAADRRAWSIPVFGVWVPFFTATNTAGETHLSAEALGAPVRLAREKDGSAKIADSGRPVIRLVKELSDQVRMVRENFQAGLVAYAEGIVKTMPDAYKAQADKAREKGKVIYALETRLLADTIDAKVAEDQMAAKMAKVAEADQMAAKEAPAEPEPVLVPA